MRVHKEARTKWDEMSRNAEIQMTESFFPLSREFPRNREHFPHLFPHSISIALFFFYPFDALFLECRLSPSFSSRLFHSSFSFLRISRHSPPSPFSKRSVVFVPFRLLLSLPFILPISLSRLIYPPLVSSFIRISCLSTYSP